MDKKDLSLLFAYNRWANARVLAACQSLSLEQLREPAQLSFGNLLGTLAHILGAEVAWRTRLQEGLSPTFIHSEADFDSLDALAAYWQEETRQMEAFIEALDETDTGRWVEFTTTSGKPQGATLWRALAHVVNHGTAFRAEAGTALARLGHSPGDLDLLLFLRETDQR